MTNMPKASESTKCVVQTCSDFFLKVPLTQCYVSRPHSSHDSTFYIQRQIQEIFKQTEKLRPLTQMYRSSTSGEVSSIQQLAYHSASHAVPPVRCAILLRLVNIQRFQGSKVTKAKIGPAK